MRIAACSAGLTHERNHLRRTWLPGAQGGFVHAHVSNLPEACRWIFDTDSKVGLGGQVAARAVQRLPRPPLFRLARTRRPLSGRRRNAGAYQRSSTSGAGSGNGVGGVQRGGGRLVARTRKRYAAIHERLHTGQSLCAARRACR
jgi:hypothetical protein